MCSVKEKVLVDLCMSMFISQEKKEGEDSDEEGKKGAAGAGKPASDSDEDSESEEEEVVNIELIFQENGCLLQREQELVVIEEYEHGVRFTVPLAG